MSGLARELDSLGHTVCAIGLEDQEPWFRAAGIEFVSACIQDFPHGEVERRYHPIRTMFGLDVVREAASVACDVGIGVLKDGERAVRVSRADALILDSCARGFEMVAMNLGIPFAHLSAQVHEDYSGGTPPCYFDWGPDASMEAIARNKAGVRSLLQLAGPGRAAALKYLSERGITPDLSTAYPFLSKQAWITQVPKEFDFASPLWPEQLFHAGLISPPEVSTTTEFPWERLTGDPFIYVTMGTMLNGSAERLRLVVQAAQAKGRQVVVSTGPYLQPDDLGELAENTITVSYAPQIDLLKLADLCITHGGLNTVLESLYHGVPLVVLPIGFDQPGVAARVAHFGVGRFLNTQTPDRDVLAAMIEEVLGDPSYRNAARRMQEKIAWQNGAQRAARHLHDVMQR
ncbi:nucleotide disphospho-sugar-binding domain-containing protein [Acidisarcina polymorpha]|nr:nucleotide disphospho-sugar-binding domain-containing protein [Acidisarcina polymorpha]